MRGNISLIKTLVKAKEARGKAGYVTTLSARHLHGVYSRVNAIGLATDRSSV